MFLNAGGTVQTSSASGNRYTYTGREWDEELELYHYRARMYDPASGRFCGRDPIGYYRMSFGLYGYVGSRVLVAIDPSGMAIVTGPVIPTPAPSGGGPPIPIIDPVGILGPGVVIGGFPTVVRRACDFVANARGNGQNLWPPNTDWGEQINLDCLDKARNIIDTDPRSNDIWRWLSQRNCGVELACECCPSKSSGGYYNSDQNRMVICANNSFASITSVLHHELMHAVQDCRNPMAEDNCIASLKDEMAAYYCANQLSNQILGAHASTARRALYRALDSSCGRFSNRCQGIDLTDAVKDELLDWFNENRGSMCDVGSSQQPDGPIPFDW